LQRAYLVLSPLIYKRQISILASNKSVVMTNLFWPIKLKFILYAETDTSEVGASHWNTDPLDILEPT
jgi:hypothetical protein